MRVISQSELLRATKFELRVLLREITSCLPHLAEGSHELRIAHYMWIGVAFDPHAASNIDPIHSV